MCPAHSYVTPFAFVLNDDTRILAVDDDPIMREFASVYLSTHMASVETAATAEVGLRKLERGDFDIALVDLEMPGMGGMEMIRHIRADRRLCGLPVVVVTGHDDIISIDRSYEAGATSFVTKPINWRLLSYQIRYVLRAQRVLA
ncbi:MAG: response regulator [Pseudomonadota bacterium]|nr:response regulator [Pseudomonadota bacterium]